LIVMAWLGQYVTQRWQARHLASSGTGRSSKAKTPHPHCATQPPQRLQRRSSMATVNSGCTMLGGI
jgi:hypothetical protein